MSVSFGKRSGTYCTTPDITSIQFLRSVAHCRWLEIFLSDVVFINVLVSFGRCCGSNCTTPDVTSIHFLGSVAHSRWFLTKAVVREIVQWLSEITHKKQVQISNTVVQADEQLYFSLHRISILSKIQNFKSFSYLLLLHSTL